MAEAPGAAVSQDDPVADERKRRGFPAPITILVLVLVLVWLATFFIPSGQYQLDGSGQVRPGSPSGRPARPSD